MSEKDVLIRPGFDLDTAVFLAQAASIAYGASAELEAWANRVGFVKAVGFDAGDVQGFWCADDGVALLVFRGTSNPGQWLRDARFLPASHPWGHVHIGFRNGVAAVESALAAFDSVALASKHVWVTGHSLGGALALVASARLKIKTGVAPLLHTYGQPAVGLNDFAERFSIELPGRLWRFVNQSDVVTRVPPGPFYRHTGVVKRIVRPGVLESLAAARTQLEAAPPTPDYGAAIGSVVAGGAALESATAVSRAGVERPQFIELDAVPLTELEFSQLQLALGAAAGPGLEGPMLEGAMPWFRDHAISEYIRLLSEIRAAEA